MRKIKKYRSRKRAVNKETITLAKEPGSESLRRHVIGRPIVLD